MDTNTKIASRDAKIATTEAAKLSEKVYSIKIRSEKDMEAAVEILSDIKRTHKGIESKRLTITGPMNQALKSVNEMFKNPLQQLKDSEALVKEAMLKYHQSVEKRAANKAKKIEASVDAGELGLAEGMGKLSNVKQAPTSVEGFGGTTSFKKTRTLAITDIAKLPAKYFLRDRVIEAIRLEVAADIKAGADVPSGAEYIETKQVAIRNA